MILNEHPGPHGGATGQRILDVLKILDRHELEAKRVVNMVPSENSMSSLAKLPMLLDVYHRYFFNAARESDQWSFRGAQDVAELESEFAIPLLREMTGATHVNLRPLSGLSGMAMVLSALGGPIGTSLLSIAPEQGGHYATAKLASRLGLRPFFLTGSDAHSINYDSIAAKVKDCNPQLVYIDQSNCLFPVEIDKIVQAVRGVRPETIVHVDISHWLGFVLGGIFQNPLTLGADSFGGSTHKSFPGPQKAIVATNRDDIWKRVSTAQYEMISSHHFATVISLGIALLEFKECGGADYAANVVQNTRRFGEQLCARGIHVEAADRGFSSGHQLWIHTTGSDLDAFTWSDKLYDAGIRVNAFSDLPGIPNKVLRVGLNEATYHGLQSDDIDALADIFRSAVSNQAPSVVLAERVAGLRAKYNSPYSYQLNSRAILTLVESLLTRTSLLRSDFRSALAQVGAP